MDEAELIRRTGAAEAVLVGLDAKISASYLEACPSVKYIGLCGTSMVNIDLQAVKDRGVTLHNVTDYGDEPTAEYIFMQLVSLARGQNGELWRGEHHELMGKRITIIGLGALGGAIAHLALAYKMQVNYFSRTRKPEWEKRGVRYGELRELLSETDIVVTSVSSNTMVLGADEFRRLPDAAIFAQASMGSTFDESAFRTWIGRPGNLAVFDAAAGEANYRAFKDTPHVVFSRLYGGYTIESKRRLGQKVLENLRGYFG